MLWKSPLTRVSLNCGYIFLNLLNYQITHLPNCPDWPERPEHIEVMELSKVVG